MKTIQQKLHSLGLKATAQRILVYQVLMELKHSAADDIARKVREQMPTITVATVYLILDSFAKVGLIRHLPMINGKLAYDITPGIHPHLVDLGKMRIEDYCNKELQDLIFDYLKNNPISGFSVENLSLSLVGSFQDKDKN